MKKKLLNAFSLNMLAMPAVVHFDEISIEEARKMASVGLESAVGHADTAAVFSSQLGVEIPAVRATVALQKGEQVLVGQYRGPRLPEGAKELPAGATIQWVLVRIE